MTTQHDTDNLTVWDSASERIDTQYGRIKYSEWLALEKKRFAAHGVKTEIRSKVLEATGVTIMALRKVSE